MIDFPPPPTRDPPTDSRTGNWMDSWLKWFGLVAREFQTDDVPPAVPTGLALTTGLENVAQTTVAFINATWTANTETDLDYYVIRIRKGSETVYQEYAVSIPTSGGPSYKFSPLVVNASYSVSVRAIDDSGNGSAYSAEVTIASAGDTTAPAVPTGLAAAAAGIKQIRVTWTANTEADLAGYELHASTTSGFTPSDSTKIAFVSDATSFTYDTPAYTTYYFKLRAKDQNGNFSGYTAQVSATSSQVVTVDITDANITTAKIATANITTALIADASITTAKIVDANITTAKIANLAVTTATIADLNVTTLKINGEAVTTAKRQQMSSFSTYYSLAANESQNYLKTHSLGVTAVAVAVSGNTNVATWVSSTTSNTMVFVTKELSGSAQSGTHELYYW